MMNYLRYASRRIIPFQRRFSTCRINNAVTLSEEREIRQKLNKLSNLPQLVVSMEQGNANDEELKTIAQLQQLAKREHANVWDYLKMSDTQRAIFQQNQLELLPFYNNGRKIIDKIPVQDPVTGQRTWEIVRQGDKRGWENIWYYGYIPAIGLLIIIYIFKDDSSINSWAIQELRLQTENNYKSKQHQLNSESGLSPQDEQKRHDLIVERILNGEYDRLRKSPH